MWNFVDRRAGLNAGSSLPHPVYVPPTVLAPNSGRATHGAPGLLWHRSPGVLEHQLPTMAVVARPRCLRDPGPVLECRCAAVPRHVRQQSANDDLPVLDTGQGIRLGANGTFLRVRCVSRGISGCHELCLESTSSWFGASRADWISLFLTLLPLPGLFPGGRARLACGPSVGRRYHGDPDVARETGASGLVARDGHRRGNPAPGRALLAGRRPGAHGRTMPVGEELERPDAKGARMVPGVRHSVRPDVCPPPLRGGPGRLPARVPPGRLWRNPRSVDSGNLFRASYAFPPETGSPGNPRRDASLRRFR